MNIKLWENEIPYFTEGAETPNNMKLFLLDTDKPLPCIVVLPGGGYKGLTAHERDEIAEFFNSEGMHAVIVEYRVAPNRHPAPLADAQRAIKLVRANASEWKIDQDRIVAIGFSAGGHLCASTAVCKDVSLGCHTPDEIDAFSPIPNGAILCYPVISIDDDFGHAPSGRNLLGEKFDEGIDEFSLQNHVGESTPKCFLFHTSDDNVVNVKNSLVFAERLRDCNIPFEMHIYPSGYHGVGLARQFGDIKNWAHLAADWVRRNI